MIRLNNKGQSLVMFIMVIPILLLLFVLVIDVGNMILVKQNLDNTNYLATSYALDHIEELDIENRVTNLININSEELTDIDIDISEDKVLIVIKKKTNSFFSNNFNITSSYEGYIENNMKRIKKG